MSNKQKKVLVIVMISIMLLALIPIVYIAKFNVPAVDDYGYGINTYNAWNETRSIGRVFRSCL